MPHKRPEDRAAYRKAYDLSNVNKIQIWKKEAYLRNKKIYDAALALGCVDCGITDPRVLQFDHADGTKIKNRCVATYIASGPERLQEEIAKCVVRCANHHAIKTFEMMKEKGHYKYGTAIGAAA